MLIAIPSKGRSGRCKTVRFLSSYGTVYCPEDEVNQYKIWGCTVIGIPLEVKGIVRTRNWILDHTDERWVVFLDDDMRRAGYVKFLWTKSKRVAIRAPTLMDEFQRLFEVAEGMELPVWCVSNNSSFRNFYAYSPFVWQTALTSACMGILNEPEGLRFDESYEVHEGYEMGLRCLKQYGAIVAARYFYFETEIGSKEGGTADYRTPESGKAAIQKLLTSYPGLVRKISKKNDVDEIEVLTF